MTVFRILFQWGTLLFCYFINSLYSNKNASHFISPKPVSHINRIEAKKHISLHRYNRYAKFRHHTQLKWKTALNLLDCRSGAGGSKPV